MPSPNLHHAAAQLLPIAYLRLEGVGGCHYDAKFDAWVQDMSTAVPAVGITVNVVAVNHTPGLLQFVALSTLWVHGGLSPYTTPRFDLKPGESKAFDFKFERLSKGDLAAFYASFVQEDPPWNPNQGVTPVGAGLALRFHSKSFEINQKP